MRKRKSSSNRREASAESLRWAQKNLPEYFGDDSAPYHDELMQDLEDADKRLIARVAPRGHAKSTCAALAYPLWCICTRRKRNIVIITHETALATQFVRDIRNELESNELILAEYGDLCSPAVLEDPDASKKPAGKRSAKGAKKPRPKARVKWTEAMFTTNTGVTVHAKGSGSSLRGVRVGPRRPDLIICDDIEKDEHVRSAESRQKLEHWLRRVVMPALAPDGQLLVLGSIIHHDSLLANLANRQRFPRWDYRVYRAIEAELRPDGNYYRVALWPGRWPLDRLEEERERVGTLAFEQEYQANPIDDTVRVFREEWLRRYDESELVEENLLTLMAVDPATGVSGGDFFATWVGSIDQTTGVIYTRELTLERIGIVKQISRIVELFSRWRPLKIGIETVAYQVALKDILEEHSRRNGLYMPIVPIQTIANKRARIEGTAPFFENGTFRLPLVVDEEVINQFLQFPQSRHDDAPDVCAMGIELARGLRAATDFDGVAGGNGNPFHRGGTW